MTGIKLAWLIITAVGFGNAVAILCAAWNDYRRLRGSLEPSERFLSRVIFHSSLFSFALHCEFLVASLSSLFVADPPTNFIVGRVLSASVLTIHAIKVRDWRGHLTVGHYNNGG